MNKHIGGVVINGRDIINFIDKYGADALILRFEIHAIHERINELENIQTIVHKATDLTKRLAELHYQAENLSEELPC